MSEVSRKNMWGDLPKLAMPVAIGQEKRLELKPAALAVLMAVLQEQQKGNHREDGPVLVRMSHLEIMATTGLTTNPVAKGVKELQGRYLNRIKEPSGKGFDNQAFQILHPENGSALDGTGTGSLLFRHDIRYFQVPSEFVTKDEPWCLRRIGSSELMVYVAACFMANQTRENLFDVQARDLRELAGVKSTETFAKALEALVNLGLLSVEQHGRSLSIALCDPWTRTPIHEQLDEDPADDLSSFREPDGRGRTKATSFNLARPVLEQLLKQSLRPGMDEIVMQGNGGWKVVCPYHADRNPSCSVDFDKQRFNCFGCEAKGTLKTLVLKLGDYDTVEYAKRVGGLTGKTIVPRVADSRATGEHVYMDRKGYPKKRILRMPNDLKTGDKVFKQQSRMSKRWVDGGGPKMLYGLERFDFASYVVCVEGEKDADTVNHLELSINGQMACATTSGGAQSWEDHFAAELQGKTVVLMPDADEAGANYRDEIAASLDTRSIPYKVVDFAPHGVKDVTEYLESGRSKDDLLGLITAALGIEAETAEPEAVQAI
ncbi:CHC2 zinc finger domain-containing protein [Acidipila sp. EB88]|uniref:CHC2 zinc finger domain-containing protein n=1 Tax=Acidipila sp. EB88 TaxID=2305226 RepID=UPI000F5D5FEE|nr:CHC2 zinc finger domain-containing protein [Acidipila sp. EB88]RRA49006.1 hypothetical protein D1Y84_12690 [Acidipila sp. EB88]